MNKKLRSSVSIGEFDGYVGLAMEAEIGHAPCTDTDTDMDGGGRELEHYPHPSMIRRRVYMWGFNLKSE